MLYTFPRLILVRKISVELFWLTLKTKQSIIHIISINKEFWYACIRVRLKHRREKFCFEMSFQLFSWRYIYSDHRALRTCRLIKTCCSYTAENFWNTPEMLEPPTAYSRLNCKWAILSQARVPFRPHPLYGLPIIKVANLLRLQQDKPELWKCSLSLLCLQWWISWQQIRRELYYYCRRNNLQGNQLNNSYRS